MGINNAQIRKYEADKRKVPIITKTKCPITEKVLTKFYHVHYCTSRMRYNYSHDRSTTVTSSDNDEDDEDEEEKEEVENVKVVVREVKECDKIEELMSQQAINNLLWDDTNRHSDVGKIKISDLISIENIEHTVSSSLPKNYMLKECDTISRIRGVSSCSKDTLLFIDQPSLLNGDEDGLLENSRAHWVRLDAIAYWNDLFNGFF
ncbi:unnamed protein product [Diamesa hyperborea]